VYTDSTTLAYKLIT